MTALANPYMRLDFATLVSAGRVRLLDWRVDVDGVERGYDHATRSYCDSPGRFPGSR